MMETVSNVDQGRLSGAGDGFPGMRGDLESVEDLKGRDPCFFLLGFGWLWPAVNCTWRRPD
jgi:hypothetical protein